MVWKPSVKYSCWEYSMSLSHLQDKINFCFPIEGMRHVFLFTLWCLFWQCGSCACFLPIDRHQTGRVSSGFVGLFFKRKISRYKKQRLEGVLRRERVSSSYVWLGLCDVHIVHPYPIHLPLPLYSLSTLPTSPTTKKKNLVVETGVCHSVSHSVYPFIYTSSIANIYCSDLLVWYEASDFCYSINTITLLRFLLDILLLPWVMEIL